MTKRITGLVKFFNETKGFGFVSVVGMPDVFVHATVAKPFGKPLLRGAVIVANVNRKARGWCVTEIFLVGDAPAENWVPAVLRFYRASEGFGFAELLDGRQVHIPRRVFDAAGIEALPGLPVELVARLAEKGLRATSLRQVAAAVPLALAA